MSGRDLKRIEFHGEPTVDFDNAGFIVISSILACVALLSRSVPVLIGAMILAPAFDPLVAIPFSLLNRDWKLLRQGVISSLILFAVAFIVCLATVWVIDITHAVPANLESAGADMVTERLTVGLHSIIIALVAGAGGALASASGRQSVLVGVVVALALVPALAAAAIGFARGGLSGWGGLGLFAVNVGGIVISGLFILYLRFGVGRLGEKIDEQQNEPR